MKKHLLNFAFLLPAFAVLAQSNVQLTLPFDGTIADFAKSRTVTAHGSPVFAPNSKGEANKALRLNGTSQYLDVDTNFIKGIGSYSVSLWFKPTDLTNYHYILNSGATNANSGITIGTYNSKAFVTYRTPTTVINNSLNSIPNIIEMDKWYHLAAVYNATNENLTAYINGQLVGDFTGTPFANDAAFPKLYIGVQGNFLNGYFKGDLDEIIVFNKAITPNEIALLYQSLVTSVDAETVTNTDPCASLFTSEANGFSTPAQAIVTDVQGRSFSPSYITANKAHYTPAAGIYLVQDFSTHCKTKMLVK